MCVQPRTSFDEHYITVAILMESVQSIDLLVNSRWALNVYFLVATQLPCLLPLLRRLLPHPGHPTKSLTLTRFYSVGPRSMRYGEILRYIGTAISQKVFEYRG